MPVPIITLITDYGESDHLVGSMKGVIYGINPDARIVDITHRIRQYDVVQASYVLDAAACHFPVPTIHVIVVDPGVGSPRRPLLAVGENHYYVCPDNGIITRVLKSDNISAVIVVEEEHFMLPRTCETFHGRDVFAPIAAWLSKYFNAQLFGDPVEDYIKLQLPKPRIIKERMVKCEVILVDSFGNLVTNMERVMYQHARKKFPGKSIKFKVGDMILADLKKSFFEVDKGKPVAYFGSMDMLEIAVREGHASKMLKVKRGDPVFIQFGE